MSEKTDSHWRKVMNTAFLNGDEIPAVGLDVVIASYKKEKIYSQKSRVEEEHITLLFKDVAKPMILTNRKAKQISAAVGTPLMDEWAGKKIKLVPKKEKHFGEFFDVINVEKSLEVIKPVLNEQLADKWAIAKDKVAKGMTKEKLEKHYVISDEDFAKLKQE